MRLPNPLPHVGDDFDWQTRDYDGFRRHMLEDLAARFPSRTRWTAADLEVVLVEVLAAALDQLSDATDRVFAESMLETARRPENVLRLLQLIGFDPTAGLADPATATSQLLSAWANDPPQMEAARREGPKRLHEPLRMVTRTDFESQLQRHPLVERAHASSYWSGSYWMARVAVTLLGDMPLDDTDRDHATYPEELRVAVDRFHREYGVPTPVWPAHTSQRLSARIVLLPYVDRFRLVGQPVELAAARPVGIAIGVSLRIGQNYFQSEVLEATRQRLGRGPGQFFEPGRRRFGESLYLSDIVQALFELEGVENVCVTRLKRVGRRHGNAVDAQVVRLLGLEIARCDNDPLRPDLGYFRVNVHGGQPG